MEYIDQTGNKIMLESRPSWIVSLVPSQTELLFYLGLDDEIAGITRYCILPKEKTATKIKIGGTKRFNFDAINKIQPDLIIGNKEENYYEGIKKLQEKYPVWLSDISNLDNALNMIRSIAHLVNKNTIANKLCADIKRSFFEINFKPSLTVAYLIWKNPYMTVGGDTFISDMLNRCGFTNWFEEKNRYPKITENELSGVDLILLSSEPFPFQQDEVKHLRERLSNPLVYLVDGSMFSWYGSRLRYTPAYFRRIHEALGNPKILHIT